MRMNKKQYNPAGFDLDLFLPYLLNQAAEVTSRSFQTIYRVEYGMTRTQWRVMANLSKHGSMTAVEICRLTFIEKTKVSRAVQALAEKGYLTRAAVIGDGIYRAGPRARPRAESARPSGGKRYFR